MKFRYLFPILAMLLLMHGISAFAQSNASNKNISIYSANEFDIQQNNLPINFKGNNFISIYTSLANLKLTDKGEFETTENYEKRLKEVANASTQGSLKVSSLYSAVPLHNDFYWKYDADSKIMTYKGKMILGFYGDEPFDLPKKFAGKFIPIQLESSKNKYKRSYVGTNALGVSTNVKEYDVDEHYIAIVNADKFNFKKREEFQDLLGYDQLEFSFKLSADIAQKIKPSLRFAIIYRIVSPYITKKVDVKTATIDSPSEWLGEKKYIYANLEQLWIYDNKTGLIIEKIVQTAD